MHTADDEITLELPAYVKWIPAAQSVVERGAPAFGLPQRKVLRMVMAVEEIIAHLARVAPGCPVRLNLARNGSRVDATLLFKSDLDDLWAMNLTTHVDISPTDEMMDHMGLLLAAGVSDGFTVSREGGSVRLALSQDREYPQTEPSGHDRMAIRGPLLITETPEPGEVAEACALALSFYPLEKVHPSFHTAGKLVDDMAAGTVSLAVAKDQAGAILGLMCWERMSEKAISFCGPYVFAQEPGPVAEALTEHMLNQVARSAIVGVYSRLATDELPTEGFELLACIHYCHAQAQCREQRVWFRLLREDDGAVVWAHAGMLPFLQETYARLSLVRDIRTVEYAGEDMADRSVFAADLHPERSEANLRMMLPGRDVAENIRNHVEHLAKNGYENILFTIDLASPEQAAQGGALLANGFQPSLLLPFAGRSDQVVFQYVPRA